MIKEGNALPSSDSLAMRMRMNPVQYILFCHYVLKYAYGVYKWKARVYNNPIVDFVTSSFEAFILLAYENCYELFNEDIQGGNVERRYKYTSDSKLAGKYKGWPVKAIKRYNVIHSAVRLDRSKNKQFDENFIELMSEKKRAKRKRRVIKVFEVEATNNFDDNIDWSGY